MPRLRLSAHAEADIAALLDWSEAHFGRAGRLRYETLVIAALDDLANDPRRAGSKERLDLGRGVRCYHLLSSRKRRRGAAGNVRRPRHLILYRIRPEFVDVGRILHDAMDVERHVPEDYREAE
jgi:toxin ParE1/3/4